MEPRRSESRWREAKEARKRPTRPGRAPELSQKRAIRPKRGGGGDDEDGAEILALGQGGHSGGGLRGARA